MGQTNCRETKKEKETRKPTSRPRRWPTWPGPPPAPVVFLRGQKDRAPRRAPRAWLPRHLSAWLLPLLYPSRVDAQKTPGHLFPPPRASVRLPPSNPARTRDTPRRRRRFSRPPSPPEAETLYG